MKIVVIGGSGLIAFLFHFIPGTVETVTRLPAALRAAARMR